MQYGCVSNIPSRMDKSQEIDLIPSLEAAQLKLFLGSTWTISRETGKWEVWLGNHVLMTGEVRQGSKHDTYKVTGS